MRKKTRIFDLNSQNFRICGISQKCAPMREARTYQFDDMLWFLGTVSCNWWKNKSDNITQCGYSAYIFSLTFISELRRALTQQLHWGPFLACCVCQHLFVLQRLHSQHVLPLLGFVFTWSQQVDSHTQPSGMSIFCVCGSSVPGLVCSAVSKAFAHL